MSSMIGKINGENVHGRFQTWVVKQSEVWVDTYGHVYLIKEIDPAYALNILLFLYETHYARIAPARYNPLIQALRERVLG